MAARRVLGRRMERHQPSGSAAAAAAVVVVVVVAAAAAAAVDDDDDIDIVVDAVDTAVGGGEGSYVDRSQQCRVHPRRCYRTILQLFVLRSSVYNVRCRRCPPRP